MNGFVRTYLAASQIVLIAIGATLLVAPGFLLGDNGYVIGVRFVAMILGFALIGLSLPTLFAVLRGSVGALRYSLAGLLILHAPMAAVFTYNIGAFDYAFEQTGLTVAFWLALWVIAFGGPTLYCLLSILPRGTRDGTN